MSKARFERSQGMTAELYSAVLEDVANGEAVRNVLVHWQVSCEAFYTHRRLEAERAQRYAAAKREAVEPMVDQAIQVAIDTATRKGITPGEVQAARLLIDTIKWAATKLLPKLYGDKVEVEHRGSVDLLGELNRRQAA